MTQIPLLGAPYQGRSIISSAQRAVNLYAELNSTPVASYTYAMDPQAPVPVTYYPTPGSVFYAQDPTNKRAVRGAYRTSKGLGYCVIGANLYFVNSNGALAPIGVLADRPSQVYFADNGLVVVLVDGVNGYAVDIETNTFGQIIDPAFYGADFVAFLDTFFVFNRPGTNQFYISLSQVDFGMLTNSGVSDGSITTPGASYPNGNYPSVPLTGGSGTGAIGDITVGGTGASNGTIVGGGSYVNGTYANVPLTGGAGTGAKADITVAGGIVTTVVMKTAGTGFAVGNVLSANNANLGGSGAGFTYTLTAIGGAVTSLDIIAPGSGYAVGDVLSVDAASFGASGQNFTWTISATNTAFDPLDIAAKSGSADPISAILVIHRELWLIGQLTTEVWIGTGAADFYFQEQQGVYIDHGCAAPYSAAASDVLGMWLMQDRQGQAIVVQGKSNDITEISTPRIVEEFESYPTISDAIGFCFQVSDHAFYCLTFPTANKTWLFELKTGRWCEWAWTDENGVLNRHRANCCMFIYNKVVVGDWENGKLLTLDPAVYTDELSPITRIRTFPHIVGNGARITYKSFIADIEVGTLDDQNEDEPTILLSWSDDRGVTYGNPVEQTLGNLGDYLAQPSWNRLGMARDRVFKLQWSAPIKTALNGAYVEYVPANT